MDCFFSLFFFFIDSALRIAPQKNETDHLVWKHDFEQIDCLPHCVAGCCILLKPKVPAFHSISCFKRNRKKLARKSSATSCRGRWINIAPFCSDVVTYSFVSDCYWLHLICQGDSSFEPSYSVLRGVTSTYRDGLFI